MKYTKYPNGRIECEHEKCGEWHFEGHLEKDLLPEDTLVMAKPYSKMPLLMNFDESGSMTDEDLQIALDALKGI